MGRRSRKRGTKPVELARALGLRADGEGFRGQLHGMDVVLCGDTAQVSAREGIDIPEVLRRQLPEGTVVTPYACFVPLRRHSLAQIVAMVRRAAAVLRRLPLPEQLEAWRSAGDPQRDRRTTSLRMVEACLGDPVLESQVLGRVVELGFAEGLMALAEGSGDAVRVVAAIEALADCGDVAAYRWLQQQDARWFLPAPQRRALRATTRRLRARLGAGAVSNAACDGGLSVAGPDPVDAG